MAQYHIIPKNNNEGILADCTPKIVVVGDSQVGKTSVLKRIVGSPLPEEYKKTEGYAFYNYLVEVNRVNINLCFWDMSSEPNYKTALLNLTRNADLCILMYSVNSRETFKSISEWYSSIKEKAPQSCPFFLVGNKIDLEREVEEIEGEQFKDEKHLSFFIETSAVQDKNIGELINEVSKRMYKKNVS